jgi:tetratricopeptide (TPR) repeat protein
LIRPLTFRRHIPALTSLAFVTSLVLVAAMKPSALAGDKEKSGVLSPAELAQLADKSKVKYGTKIVQSESELPAVTYPGYPSAPRSPMAYPIVAKVPNGSRSVTQYVMTPATRKAFEEAEVQFQAKHYTEALEIYRKAAAEDPQSYLLHMEIGDSLLFAGNPVAALDEYDKALSLNPSDFHVSWFRGSALTDLKKFDEARKSYARALAMSPRNAKLIEAINNRSDRLGIEAREPIFHAKAVARQEGDSYVIYALPGNHWWIYGLCKAIWLAEEGHREALTGKKEHQWTNTGELECMANLLVSYRELRDSGKISHEPELDLLLTAMGDQQLGAFVTYEFGSQVTSEFVLYLDDPEQDKVANFVAHYVFQPAK